MKSLAEKISYNSKSTFEKESEKYLKQFKEFSESQ